MHRALLIDGFFAGDVIDIASPLKVLTIDIPRTVLSYIDGKESIVGSENAEQERYQLILKPTDADEEIYVYSITGASKTLAEIVAKKKKGKTKKDF